jgi:molecular chaperone GrpE
MDLGILKDLSGDITRVLVALAACRSEAKDFAMTRRFKFQQTRFKKIKMQMLPILQLAKRSAASYSPIARASSINQVRRQSFFSSTSFAKDSTIAESVKSEAEPVDTLAEKDKAIAALQVYPHQSHLIPQDSYRRALADAENVRQRSRKEIANAKDFAIQKFAKDLLESADILEMAIKSVPAFGESPNKDLKDLHMGVSMTRTELLKAFKRHGMEEFDPMGEVFNHDMHQAVFQAAVVGKEPGTVFDVQKKGFTLNGRCLRPAQVGVVKIEEEESK